MSRARELLRQSRERKDYALLHLQHSWKVYALTKALAEALQDSWESSSWPGDRLAVGAHLSDQVELVTQRLQRETDAWAKHVSHPGISLGG
ncbi:hypothetical protein J7E83_11365 [Arthrobacter sp. ISL-48]|nr:hypothetical protein [Arthrobacter sp. ISL-48]